MEVRISKNKTPIRASIIFSKCPTLCKGKHLCNKVPSNYTKKLHRMFYYVTENSQGVVEALKQFLTIKMALLEPQLSEVTNILYVHNLRKQGDADEFSSIDRSGCGSFFIHMQKQATGSLICVINGGMNVQFTKRHVSEPSQPLRWLCTREHDFDRMLNAHVV
jgi:hypothetical protein